jgi:hypothetical protein
MGSYPRFCGAFRWKAPAVICLTPGTGWRLLTCRVLPDLIVAAATRPNPWHTDPRPVRDPAHSPCSQPHARLAGHVTMTAGGLLPHRFAPYRHSQTPTGMLSVAVVVRTRLSPACPHFSFRGATSSHSIPTLKSRERGTGSREVPLDDNAHLATAHPSIRWALYHETQIDSSVSVGLSRTQSRWILNALLRSRGSCMMAHLTVQVSWGIL